MRTPFLISLVLAVGLFVNAIAQQPSPQLVVVPAANASPDPAVSPGAPAPNSALIRDAVNSLQQIKGANAETLKKQQADLGLLDDLQKAAAQIKIFSHRTGG